MEKIKEPEKWTHDRTPETQILVNIFRKVDDGALVSYEELELAIGQPVAPGTRGYQYVLSALKIVRNQHGKTFANKAKKGYRHLVTENDFLWLADKERKSIVRHSNKSLKKLGNAKIEEFSGEARRTIIANTTILHLIRSESQPKKVKKIEAHINEDGYILPTQKTLQILIDSKKDEKET